MSCVYRIKEKSGFGVGIQHVVEVLCGADTEKIRKWNHQTLSTYKIGTEHTRAEWSAIGRELARLGLLSQNTEKFNIVELTEAGRAALKLRQKITLTKPLAATDSRGDKHRAGEIVCDEALFEKLRQLRKRIADERGMPPYSIFSDVSVRQMARYYPGGDREFSRISGVGEKKQREFGVPFLREIAMHLKSNPRMEFAEDTVDGAMVPRRSRLTDTVRETLHFFGQGKSVTEIAKIRGVVEGTIYGHLTDAILAGEKVEITRVMSAEAWREITVALRNYRQASMTPLFEALGKRHPFGHLRICRALMQAGSLQQSA